MPNDTAGARVMRNTPAYAGAGERISMDRLFQEIQPTAQQAAIAKSNMDGELSQKRAAIRAAFNNAMGFAVQSIHGRTIFNPQEQHILDLFLDSIDIHLLDPVRQAALPEETKQSPAIHAENTTKFKELKVVSSHGQEAEDEQGQQDQQQSQP